MLATPIDIWYVTAPKGMRFWQKYRERNPMVTTKPQAISGVSADKEAVIMTVYPSIAGTGVGKMLGGLYDSMPTPVFGIKLSHLLFTLPTIPFAAGMYFLMKLSGHVYVVTNRNVQLRASLGNNLAKQVPLADIDTVLIQRDSRQAFYKAGDLVLRDKQGKELLELPGVPYPDVFRQTIIEAISARRQVTESLTRIAARG